MNIKEKVKMIVESLEMNDKNEFYYSEDLILFHFSDDSEFTIIKNKVKNLVTLMNDIKRNSDEDFQNFLDLDFETEIWYKI